MRNATKSPPTSTTTIHDESFSSRNASGRSRSPSTSTARKTVSAPTTKTDTDHSWTRRRSTSDNVVSDLVSDSADWNHVPLLSTNRLHRVDVGPATNSFSTAIEA